MKVFLSYSRRDDAIATEVRRRLEARGHEIWQDVSSIAGGADWRASIEQGIRAEQLPDGFALTLSGIEYVELFPSFEQGMNELLDVLGDAGTVAADEQVPGLAVWANKRLTESQQAAQQDYRHRVAGLIANFSQEFSRADDAISPETYQEEFRPRFWNFVGQLEGTVPPTNEFAGPHRDFVRSLRESLVNLDDAFNQLRRDEPERATRSYRRSLEQLFAALEAYTSLLD